MQFQAKSTFNITGRAFCQFLVVRLSFGHRTKRRMKIIIIMIQKTICAKSEVAMTNKEKIVKLMKKYNVEKAIYSSGLNFEDQYPCGDIVFAGELNKEFANQIWSLYDFSELEDEEKRFCVWMVPEKSSAFNAFSLQCKEVLNARI